MPSSNQDIRARIKAVPFSLPISVIAAAEAEAAAAAAAEGELKWKCPDLPDLSAIEAVAKALNKGIGVLSKVLSVLDPILRLVELFVTAFNSINSIILAFINLAQNELNKWAEDIAGSGIFFNMLVPPVLDPTLVSDVNWQGLSSGGFQGFLKRLQVSFYNTSDPNRPKFSADATVGGMILMIDAESFDTFFKNMNTINNLFDFVEFLPITTELPPPTNIRAHSEKDDDGKLGIKLMWDAAPIRPAVYRVRRSTTPGGEIKKVKEIPTKLGGKDGFIRALGYRKKEKKWPTQVIRYYEPVGLVASNPITGNSSFIDSNVTNGVQYYYTIESGFPPVYGPLSTEVAVEADGDDCIPKEVAETIEHENGRIELVGIGLGSLGQWSTIQARSLLPFFPILISQMNKLINTLKGMIKDASSSFGDFVQGIKDRIESYIDLVELILVIIERIASISFGDLAFLNVPPESGGIQNFMRRVRAAEPPEGGFTGPEGITAGMVFVYGTTQADVTLSKEREEANAKIAKVFELLGGS